MPVTITCDGCCTATEGLEKLGIGRPRHYCAECRGSVETFVQARNDLHTEIAREWRDGLARLEAGWRKTHPDGVLPDA